MMDLQYFGNFLTVISGLVIFIFLVYLFQKYFFVDEKGAKKMFKSMVLASFVWLIGSCVSALCDSNATQVSVVKEYKVLFGNIVCGIVSAGFYAMVDYDDKSDDSSYGCWVPM